MFSSPASGYSIETSAGMSAGDEARPQTFLSMYNGKLEEEQGLGCCMPSSFLANNSFCYNKASTTTW